MGNDLYTNEDLAAVVDNEGLGYAVQHYLAAERIADPEVRKLWQEAADALDRLSERIPDICDLIAEEQNA